MEKKKVIISNVGERRSMNKKLWKGMVLGRLLGESRHTFN